MRRSDWLTVRVQDDGDDGRTAFVSGEVDTANRGALRDALDAALADVVVLRVDLAGLEFMDSSALRDLTAFHLEAAAAGKSVQIVRPSSSVVRLLRLTDLYEQLTSSSPHACR